MWSWRSLLFHPHELTTGGIHGYSQLGILPVAVDHVPDEFVGSAAPITNINDGSIGIFAQDFVAAVLLRRLERFVGVDLQKLGVKNLRRRVARAVVVFSAGIHAAAGCIGGILARPRVSLHCALHADANAPRQT